MPEGAEAYIELGWEFHIRQQYDRAVDHFRKALELDGNAVDAYYGLGLAYKAQGRKAEAIAAFEKVLNLVSRLEDRGKAQILSQLSRAHIEQLRGTEATHAAAEQT